MIRTTALSLLFVVASTSHACMAVGGAEVRFAGQKNIIVWDKAHGTEHFVRDARFSTDGESLGFIAPTPTRPTIEAVDEAAFARLEGLSPVRYLSKSMGRGMTRGVSVVESRLVGGYQATVLRASNPQELAHWLRDNGYALPRFAVDWAAPYVQKGWYFTAFKVASGRAGAGTGPVRMSFRTDVPFNPYSVPAENGGSTGLSLYYVSAGTEEGRVGGVEPWASPQWKAPLSVGETENLATDLKLPYDAIPAKSTVSYYQDSSFGRPGLDDIYFVEASKPPSPQGLGGLLAGLGLSACVLGCAKPEQRTMNP